MPLFATQLSFLLPRQRESHAGQRTFHVSQKGARATTQPRFSPNLAFGVTTGRVSLWPLTS